MREIDVMIQMNINIPAKARGIRGRRDELKGKYNMIKVSVNPSFI